MIDLKAIIGSWYRGKNQDRFNQGPWPEKVFSPFDIPDELIQDMISRNVRPFTVQTLDLSTANQITVMVPGFHVVIYGHDNSANKAVNTTVYMELFWGDFKPGDKGFPLKHARGYSGVFEKLTLKWPAQANAFADLVIHSGMMHPWIDGESCT